MGHFLSDLDRSQEPVKRLMEHYSNAGYVVREFDRDEQINGDFSATLLDITVNIEVKFDEMSAKTGNLCFEMSNGKKMTGIMTTQADVVHYVVPNGDTYRCYVFNTERLREFIQQPGNVTIKNGGDRRKFVLALAKVTDVVEKELPQEVFDF